MGINLSRNSWCSWLLPILRLSEEEKKEMVDNLKQKGKKVYDEKSI